ncbi:MAG: hypothetical protein AAGF46_09610, partial [Pseudomonadota bacterium]
EDYDPNEVPLNSSAIHKIDPALFDLEIAEDAPPSPPPVSESSMTIGIDVPHQAPIVRVQRWINRLVIRIIVSRAYQASFASLVLASLALLFWSLNYRVSHISDNTLALAELGQVETEMLRVRQIWSEEKMASIEEKVQSADARRVFLDYRSLAEWLRQKSAYAEQLELTFTYTLREGRPSSIDNMLEIPIEVELRGGEAGDVYLRTLEFLKFMVSTIWYVEIIETSLKGDGSGAQSAKALLRVWVHTTTATENGGV